MPYRADDSYRAGICTAGVAARSADPLHKRVFRFLARATVSKVRCRYKGVLMAVVEKLFYLALAGALGTLARYGLAGFVHRLNGVSFPWGTVTVNILGCFVAGFVWSLLESRWVLPPHLRVAVMVGFFGAFTTFSTFMLETTELVRSSEWLLALGNLVLQNGLGLMAIVVGAFLGRIL